MSSVLVTGAAGFIASNVCENLLRLGYSVIGIDNINNYYDLRLKHFRLEQLKKNPGFHFFQLDIENKASLTDIFSKYQFQKVFNLAARAGVRPSIDNPFQYLKTNTEGTINLLELCKDIEVDSFVLSSTSSVYSGSQIPFDETMPVNCPISPYAASKKSAEVFSYTYHHLYHLNVSIPRYFTVYGPAGRPDMSYFKFIQRILNNIPIDIYGDGEQTRDFTFVADIANGTVGASLLKGYNIVNLGGGNTPVSINYMVELIENELGIKAKINYHPAVSADMKDTSANISKAKIEMNWKANVSFEQGMIETIRWHKDNFDFVNQLEMD